MELKQKFIDDYQFTKLNKDPTDSMVNLCKRFISKQYKN